MKPLAVFEGHFEEVTGLVGCGDGLVSVSLDGSVRRWGSGPGDIGGFAGGMEEDAKGVEGAREEAVSEQRKGGEGTKENKDAKKAVKLTEEEEQELAELNDLMDDE